MKHTPLPWRACHEGKCLCRQIWSIPGDVPVFTARADEMAMIGLAHHKWGDGPDLIYGEIPIEETEANTRLIVTAVNCHYELLEGLKMLLESYDASGPCDCGGSSLCAICNAQKIIAKVEAMEK